MSGLPLVSCLSSITLPCCALVSRPRARSRVLISRVIQLMQRVRSFVHLSLRCVLPLCLGSFSHPVFVSPLAVLCLCVVCFCLRVFCITVAGVPLSAYATSPVVYSSDVVGPCVRVLWRCRVQLSHVFGLLISAFEVVVCAQQVRLGGRRSLLKTECSASD